MTITANLTNRPSSTSAAAPQRRPRRIGAKLALAALLVLGATVGVAGSADAATYRSYGTECSSTYHWVRQNWPNVRTQTTATTDVYYRTTLYRWTGTNWAYYTRSTLYHGLSNNNGRLVLGNYGGPYYFVYSSPTGTRIAEQRGHVFRSLPAGYYRTAEQIWVGTQYWSRYTSVAATGAAYCVA